MKKANLFKETDVIIGTNQTYIPVWVDNDLMAPKKTLRKPILKVKKV